MSEKVEWNNCACGMNKKNKIDYTSAVSEHLKQVELHSNKNNCACLKKKTCNEQPQSSVKYITPCKCYKIDRIECDTKKRNTNPQFISTYMNDYKPPNVWSKRENSSDRHTQSQNHHNCRCHSQNRDKKQKHPQHEYYLKCYEQKPVRVYFAPTNQS